MRIDSDRVRSAVEARLDAAPRLGLVAERSPLTDLGALAGALGLDSLVVKRDDLLGALHGGTKVRKLDRLLAAEPWASRSRWRSFGALGSGQLVALSAAARLRATTLEAVMFDEPVSPRVLENLAWVASGPGVVRYVGTRVELGLRCGLDLMLEHRGSVANVPPGASSVEGVLSVVDAVRELRLQVDAGETAAPSHLYVPVGSGGTAAGLALGCAVFGFRARVHAVSAIERAYVSRARLRSLAARAARALGLDSTPPLDLELAFLQVGPGYGHETEASRGALDRAHAAGVPLEGVYGAKAFAHLLAHARSHGGHVLYWLTSRSAAPLVPADDWRSRLPARLTRRLARGEAMGVDRRTVGRRLFLGAALVGGAALGVRVWPPPAPTGFVGQHLSPSEAATLAALAATLVPNVSAPDEVRALLDAADRYLGTLPTRLQAELHGALALVEHGLPLTRLDTPRFTHLDDARREAAVQQALEAPGITGQAARGVRDLLMFAVWQSPRRWQAMGYTGPLRADSTPVVPDPWPAFRASAPLARRSAHGP